MSRPAETGHGARGTGCGGKTANAQIPRLPPPAPRPERSQRGIALLIVVSLLTVLGILGVAFAFSMHLETRAAHQFVATMQARYAAEAGVSVARALLDTDRLSSRVDEMTEHWALAGQGTEVDVDGSGSPDAAWQTLMDTEAQAVGRFAILIRDESGKANLNAGQAAPSPLELGAINLTTLLSAVDLDDAEGAAAAVETYRYGEDARPGTAGVDDDGDGTIDEVDEYQVLALKGDDRRLDSLEDLAGIAGLDAEEIRALSRIATVYSWDLNVAVGGTARLNVNTATADELVAVLLDAGTADPWQAAVNMVDFVDADFEMSRVTKASQLFVIPNQGPLGAWDWAEEPEGHYASDQAQGQPLSWVVAVPAGTYRLRAVGVGGVKVGDVSVAGQFSPSVDPGDSLGIVELTGTLAVEVTNREPAGTPCAFRGIELISEAATEGTVVRGIEAVRMNEVMVEPTIDFQVTAATFEPQGSDWGCPVGSAVCTNSGVGEARWTWTSAALQPGRYYVRVLANEPGQTVGQVRVDGDTQLLVHEQTHPAQALVGSDGKITVSIGKSASEQTYYLKGVILSRQPDAEYVELINLSGVSVDVSGWTIEGELVGGRQARLPSGSVIPAHGLLLAAVDLDDSQDTLAGNGIDATTAWEIGADANTVQLEFPAGPPSPDDDWLKTSLPGGGLSRLLLKSGTVTVDEVEYPLPLPTTANFQSLEKGDPSVSVDSDLDGLDEGWYPSLQLYTPGAANDNNGLRELVGTDVIVHDPAKEVTVRNRPLDGVGELAGLPSGTAWQPFSSTDLAKIVDHFTVDGLRLEAEGALIAGQGAWTEKADGAYEYTSPAQPPMIGVWRWSDIPTGYYRLSLYGWSGEQMAVRWEREPGQFSDWSPALSADARGQVVVGQISVGMEGEPSGQDEGTSALTVEVSCQSPSHICHLDYVRLDPHLIRVGPVNINTAPLDVLEALPGMTDALASRIIAGRPYGDHDQKGRGIGDLLMGAVFGSDEETKLEVFRQLAHLLTTRSNVFEIHSLGQAMNKARVDASQRVVTVVQR